MLSVPTPGLIRLSAAETSGPLALDAPPSPGDELTEGGRLNQARSQARRIVANRHFNDAITFCILSGSVILAMDAPGDDDIEKEPWSRPVDVAFTIIFTIEAALKILALGFCSYLHDHWNKLDIIVVLEGWISVFSTGSSSGLKVRTGETAGVSGLVSRLWVCGCPCQ